MGIQVYGAGGTFFDKREEFPDAFYGRDEGRGGGYVDNFGGRGIGSRRGDGRVEEGSFLDFLAWKDALDNSRRGAGGVMNLVEVGGV